MCAQVFVNQVALLAFSVGIPPASISAFYGHHPFGLLSSKEEECSCRGDHDGLSRGQRRRRRRLHAWVAVLVAVLRLFFPSLARMVSAASIRAASALEQAQHHPSFFACWFSFLGLAVSTMALR